MEREAADISLTHLVVPLAPTDNLEQKSVEQAVAGENLSAQNTADIKTLDGSLTARIAETEQAKSEAALAADVANGVQSDLSYCSSFELLYGRDLSSFERREIRNLSAARDLTEPSLLWWSHEDHDSLARERRQSRDALAMKRTAISPSAPVVEAGAYHDRDRVIALETLVDDLRQKVIELGDEVVHLKGQVGGMEGQVATKDAALLGMSDALETQARLCVDMIGGASFRRMELV